LSSGFGGPSNTKKSICAPTHRSPRPAHPSGSMSASTTTDGPIHRLAGRRPIRLISMRSRQSRRRHNNGGNPLTKTSDSVQTNRTTSHYALTFTSGHSMGADQRVWRWPIEWCAQDQDQQGEFAARNRR